MFDEWFGVLIVGYLDGGVIDWFYKLVIRLFVLKY